jgi:hypothetical protein
MAVAAPILPPEPGELGLPEEVRQALRAQWAAWWEPLRAELRARPPTQDSFEERMALARFARGLVPLIETYGAALRPLLREGFARAFEELVAEEEKQTPTIRRLGLKHIARAVEVLGELYEAALAFAPPRLPVEDAAQLLPDADEAVARLLDPPSVALLRLELYAFIAFDLVREDPLEEFVAWARKAHTAARCAAPFVTMLAAYSRAASGELSPDVVLPAAAFDHVVDLVENPPAPSARLRQLLRRGTA